MKIYDFKNGINDNDLKEIKEIILNDGILVIPTETVYGIGANIYSDIAINKIFSAKGRPNDNPLIVHVSDLSMLDEIVSEIDLVSRKLIDNFWPGPLTIIFPKKDNISNLITANLDTVGVRMPANEIACKIIDYCHVPLAAPSANVSGKPSGTNVVDIYDELFERVDAIVDGGKTDIGIESTVVKVIDGIVHILRPGKVTKEDFIKIGLEVSEDNVNRKVTKDEKVLSPGMKYKHYAPNAETILVYSKDNHKMVKEINRLILENGSKKVVVIVSLLNKDKYNADTLIMGDDLSSVSQNIFSLLREADRMNPDLIIIEGVVSEKIGSAIMNRLIKACSHNYIELE